MKRRERRDRRERRELIWNGKSGVQVAREREPCRDSRKSRCPFRRRRWRRSRRLALFLRGNACYAQQPDLLFLLVP